MNDTHTNLNKQSIKKDFFCPKCQSPLKTDPNTPTIKINQPKILFVEGLENTDDVIFYKKIVQKKGLEGTFQILPVGSNTSLQSDNVKNAILDELQISAYKEITFAALFDNDEIPKSETNLQRDLEDLKKFLEQKQNKIIHLAGHFMFPPNKTGKLETVLIDYFQKAYDKQYDCMENWFKCISHQKWWNADKAKSDVLLAGFPRSNKKHVRGIGRFLSNEIDSEGLPHLIDHVPYIKDLIDFLEQFSKVE